MPEKSEPPLAVQVKALSRIYRVQSGKAPPCELLALSDVSFDVERGDIFGIVGMSGAGKSSLLRILATLERASSGSLAIDGQEVESLSEADLGKVRLKIGFIFQELNLFSSMTALENLLFALSESGSKLSKKEQIEKAKEWLSLVGLQGKENSYPMKLSGGQRQRVAIARALVNAPSLLLCDEMTSALDPKTRRAILELLYDLSKKFTITIVLITHEMEVVRQICNKVIVLDQGKIVDSGSVEEIFAFPKHRASRELVEQLSHDPTVDLAASKGGEEKWMLTFLGRAAREPLLTQVIRGFEVEVNILLGSIDRTLKGEIGKLLVAISGAEEERKRARSFLESRGVVVERGGER